MSSRGKPCHKMWSGSVDRGWMFFTLTTIETVSAAWPSKIWGDAPQQTSPSCFDVRTDEREDGTSCPLSSGGGKAVWAGVWEYQSQQQEAQQGAEGLLGRMQAKGIVGNYTGLERASNALIQQDIFIKKQGCRTGTKRASERESPAAPGLLRISLCTELSALCVAFAKAALLFVAVCT